MITTVEYLTPEILNLLNIEDYETKSFLIRNNLTNLPLNRVFTQRGCNFSPISVLSRDISKYQMYLYQCGNYKIIIPSSTYDVNDNGLITDIYVNNCTSKITLEYDVNNNRISKEIKNHSINAHQKTYYSYINETKRQCIFDFNKGIYTEPTAVNIFHPNGYLKDSITKYGTVSYDEWSNVILTSSYAYENLYSDDILIKTIIFSEADLLKKCPRFVISFLYDDHGNWIEQNVLNIETGLTHCNKRKTIFKNNILHKIINEKTNELLYEVLI